MTPVDSPFQWASSLKTLVFTTGHVKLFFLNSEKKEKKKAVKLAPNSPRSKPTKALGCYFQ